MFLELLVFTQPLLSKKDVFDLQKYLLNQKGNTPNAFKLNKSIFQKHLPFSTVNTAPSSSYSFANGDIVTYTIGSMPIVKPSMNYFYIMPNVGMQNILFSLRNCYMAGRIPNAATPPNIFQ